MGSFATSRSFSPQLAPPAGGQEEIRQDVAHYSTSFKAPGGPFANRRILVRLYDHVRAVHPAASSPPVERPGGTDLQQARWNLAGMDGTGIRGRSLTGIDMQVLAALAARDDPMKTRFRPTGQAGKARRGAGLRRRPVCAAASGWLRLKR